MNRHSPDTMRPSASRGLVLGHANGGHARLMSPAEPSAAEKAAAIHAARRGRDDLFGHLGGDLFGEPAWDLLLDLFVARQEGRPISVTSACAAASVPKTTALRWIARLQRSGLLVRTPDRHDRRSSNIALTARAADLMNAWLSSWT